MKRFIRARDADERGVVLVIVALAMVVLIGMLAIAIDASYGFVQNRRAQNASDFAAFAAAEELNNSVSCNGSQQPTMDQVVSIIDKLISENDPDVKHAWVAEFINNQGKIEDSTKQFGYSDYQNVYPTGIPENTCGVSISVTPSWPSFFAGIFGLHRLGGFATASVAPTSPTATGIGIVALNEAGPHEVLGGGTGKFVVSGTIFLNTNVATQPWSSSSTSISGTAPIGTVTTPSIVITTGSNDTLDIAVGGTRYPLTILPGNYTGTALLNAIPDTIPGLTFAYNYAGDLVLSSGESSLQVTGGDALSTLGLSTLTTPLTAEWDDAIDAKANSNLYVYGTIDTNEGPYNGETLWPLDHCFQPQGEIPNGTGTPPTLLSGEPPEVQMSCDLNSSVTVDYNSIDTSFGQEKDPLLPADGGPPNPINSLSTDNCPGMNLQTYSSPLPDNTSVLYPGVYTQPVDLTGSATFEDCSGYSGQPANNGNPEGAYPGIYVFTDGLTIDPAAGDTVSGSDIVIATQSPYPVAGNVPGSVTGGMFTASGAGNGAPCLPEGTLADTQSADGVSPGYETVQGGTPCGGTNPAEYGVEAYTDLPIQQDTTETGTGTNFSLIVGGGTGSKVSLTGPTTGAYGGDGTDGIVFYQDPTTPANYGFDAETADSATIQINGVVYNASIANYGVGGPLDFWDGKGGGVVFYQGGTLQTGFGTGWTNGPAPSTATGSVTLNGTAVVDDFNTDGYTAITIEGGTYTPPSANGLQLIG